VSLTIFFTGCLAMLLGGLLTAMMRGARSMLAVAGVWVGSAIVAVPVVTVLLGYAVTPLTCAWLPGGTLSFGLDALSAFFCLPILLIGPLAATYGRAYLGDKPTGAHWLFFAMLLAAMLLLTVCRNALMFLIVWEVMAVASFFLVMFDHEQQTVRSAGWTYLVATHIGTMALLLLFAWLGAWAGSLEFDKMAALRPPVLSGVGMFMLALVGFGVKAGFLPLHVWLPEAHPAAPSHVSALMSGVMIKTGIYGLLRIISLIGPPTAFWGWALLAVGVASGIAGVANALAQHDLKRLLAYHSVETIGIIAMGLGAGLLGVTWHSPTLALLGFGGALLHVLNHSVFKSLLFLGAGAVAHETGTRDIERLGGLLRRMPVTGAGFLVGSAAIAGLPPLNGFISEFYLYLAGIHAIQTHTTGPILLAAAILTGLALIGGLAVACFAKAFGIVFLGEPRSPQADRAHEAPAGMLLPMRVLAALCFLIALAAPWTVRGVFPAVSVLSGDAMPLQSAAATTAGILGQLSLLFLLLLALVGGLYLIRRNLPRGSQQTLTGTWDCGYARPTARMQYTASSFAQPLTDLFAAILRTHRGGKPVEGAFPENTDFYTHTDDAVKERVFAPVFRLVERWVAPIRRLQHGNLHGYLLYIAITLIVLLVWKVGF